ncbi:hypothetical protein [Stappia stellulata]|uniref:hypothetical protein n=1 Tax=Stappia stellulata TaxID=71235 RepID=UPI00055A7DC6|nr:hypothetical protein [Stappia stellulata]
MIDLNDDTPSCSWTHLLEAASENAVTDFEIEFCGSLREKLERFAERLETTKKVNDVQRRMLEAAARSPRDRNELSQLLRDGLFLGRQARDVPARSRVWPRVPSAGCRRAGPAAGGFGYRRNARRLQRHAGSGADVL